MELSLYQILVQLPPMPCEPQAGRCTGHCCEKLHLPWDPAGLYRAVETTKLGTDTWQDIEFIWDMVIYQGPYRGPIPSDIPEGQKFHEYTCRHFDKVNKLCTVYDKRPQMCRQHGVSYPCDTQGCTMTDAKRDPLHMGPAKLPEPSDASLE